jgi:hypothetical protein
MNAKLKKTFKTFQAPYHVGTSMKKYICLVMQTPKNINGYMEN